MSQFNLPLDPSLVQSILNQSGISSNASTIGTLGVSVPIVDPSFVKANAAFDKANTISVYTTGVDNTQNTTISTVYSLANTIYNFANGLSGGTATDGVARLGVTQLNTYAASAYATANAAYTQANTVTSYTQGVDTTQNTNISAVNSYAASVYTLANTHTTNINSLNNLTASAYSQANSANTLAAGAYFPAGTALIFQQSAAPTGWTKQTTHNDKALRIVSGTAASGGSVAFSSAFSAGTTVDGTAISVSQMPAHNHVVSDPGHNHTLSDPGHSHGVYDPQHAHIFGADDQVASQGGFGVAGNFPYDAVSSTSGGGVYLYTYGSGTGIGIYGAGTGIGISGATTGISTNNNGSGGAHNHTISNLAVQYVDAIICTKN
jgi:hypothetical protein